MWNRVKELLELVKEVLENIKENVGDNARDFIENLEFDWDFMNTVMDWGLRIWIALCVTNCVYSCLGILIQAWRG